MKTNKIRKFSEFIEEKKSPYKKATLLRFKKKWDNGEEIPFGIENSLKAQGMIPRANGETKVSGDYANDSSLADIIKPKTKTPEKKKAIKESFEESMGSAEITAVYESRDGSKVEIKETNGTGMAGEDITFTYVYLNGELSSRDKVKSHMKHVDFKDLCEYLNDVAINNEESAISFIQ